MIIMEVYLWIIKFNEKLIAILIRIIDNLIIKMFENYYYFISLFCICVNTIYIFFSIKQEIHEKWKRKKIWMDN